MQFASRPPAWEKATEHGAYTYGYDAIDRLIEAQLDDDEPPELALAYNTAAGREAAVPVTVNRSYDLPGFVDERTLVIGSSYSGHVTGKGEGVDVGHNAAGQPAE